METSNLENLVALAHEPSSEKRRALLEGVTDLFLAGGEGFGAREQELADDILTAVAPRVEVDARVDMSQRLAGVDNAPQRLIRQLARDVIDVARPILQKSGVLGDADLVDIVSSMGKEYQLAISQRETVSAEVGEALVERGDDEVLESLVCNDGAVLSRQAMEGLVARSETSEGLQRPLLARGDLPADLMHEMFWSVSAALKRHILTKAAISEADIDAALAEVESRISPKPAAVSDEFEQATKEIQRLKRLGQLNQERLVQLLRQGAVGQFVAGLAELTGIDCETAKRIVFSGGHEAIAVACRATGFDLSTFSSIVLLIDSDGKVGSTQRSPTAVANLLDLYNKVPVDTAKRAMRFWRVRRQGMHSQSPEAA